MRKRISLSRKISACTNVMVLVPMPKYTVHKPAKEIKLVRQKT